MLDIDSEPPALNKGGCGTSFALKHVQSLDFHSLGRWPTPLEVVDHPTLGQIFVKRDDLSGFGGETGSGVKARKLEGLLGHMRARKLTRLRMPLGNITNLGPVLISEALALGIEVKLDLVDQPQLLQTTREAIHRRYVRHARLSGPSYGAAALRLGWHYLRDRFSGDPSLCVPPSPAHPSAIAGMARGYLEMVIQSKKQFGILPGAVYLASASGTSVAGLALGEALRRAAGDPPVRIVAVQVVPEPLRLWLPILFAFTARFLRPARFPRPEVEVVTWPEHNVYGRFNASHEATCQRVGHEFGLIIDPIYGAKSWDVMERVSALNIDRPPLFWHCGYTSNWRDLAPELRQ